MQNPISLNICQEIHEIVFGTYSVPFWNFVGIITSFIIVWITLREDRKKHRETFEEQNKQHKETLGQQRKLNIESANLLKEQKRAEALPFLLLDRKMELKSEDDCVIFPMKITNHGNSVALDIHVDHECDDRCYAYVYKEIWVDRVLYYRYSDVLYDNTLPVNESAEFEILFYMVDENRKFMLDDYFARYVKFSISFKDSYYNQYKQEYYLEFSKKEGVGRVESYLPELVIKKGLNE